MTSHICCRRNISESDSNTSGCPFTSKPEPPTADEVTAVGAGDADCCGTDGLEAVGLAFVAGGANLSGDGFVPALGEVGAVVTGDGPPLAVAVLPVLPVLPLPPTPVTPTFGVLRRHRTFVGVTPPDTGSGLLTAPTNCIEAVPDRSECACGVSGIDPVSAADGVNMRGESGGDLLLNGCGPLRAGAAVE